MKDTTPAETVDGKNWAKITTLAINVFIVLIREKIIGNTQKVRRGVIPNEIHMDSYADHHRHNMVHSFT